MGSSGELDTTTLIVLILGALILLPLLTMGMGFGGMGGFGGMMGGSSRVAWPFGGMVFSLVILFIIFGGGYLILQRAS